MQFEWTPAFSSSRPRCAASSATRVASSGAGSFVAGSRDELDREHRAEAADVADRRESAPATPSILPRIVSPMRRRVRRAPRPRRRRGRRAPRPARPGCRRRCRRRRRRPGASMISALPSTPESGRPAAIDFATVIRSGSTPKCSIANIRPVRPKPVCTSSATKTMPSRSQISRSPARTRAARTTKPPSPCTGSMTIAATVSGATASRMRARALERLGRATMPRYVVRERDAVDLGRERARAPPCTGASSTSATARAACGRGSRPRTRSPPGRSCTRGRT